MCENGNKEHLTKVITSKFAGKSCVNIHFENYILNNNNLHEFTERKICSRLPVQLILYMRLNQVKQSIVGIQYHARQKTGDSIAVTSIQDHLFQGFSVSQ